MNYRFCKKNHFRISRGAWIKKTNIQKKSFQKCMFHARKNVGKKLIHFFGFWNDKTTTSCILSTFKLKSKYSGQKKVKKTFFKRKKVFWFHKRISIFWFVKNWMKKTIDFRFFPKKSHLIWEIIENY